MNVLKTLADLIGKSYIIQINKQLLPVGFHSPADVYRRSSRALADW